MAAEFIHVIISLAILLFAAKLMAELFHRIKLPIVLGELLAGIIVGPFALGGLYLFDGEPLVSLDETVRQVGEIAAVVILFTAGLHITPREFLKGGAPAFTVGSIGVIVPFFVGYYVFTAYGVEVLQSTLIATALTATSIAISIQVLTELGRIHSPEARLILGAGYRRRHPCYSRTFSGNYNGTDWKSDTQYYRHHSSYPKDTWNICSTSSSYHFHYPSSITCREAMEVKG